MMIRKSTAINTNEYLLIAFPRFKSPLEKPLISEETDLIEPTLLDELICYIGTLASVYHKPPSAFVEGGRGVVHKSLPPRTAS